MLKLLMYFLTKSAQKVQLTLERYRFELGGSTCMWNFFSINKYILYDPWLVESEDTKQQIWKADCKVTCGFLRGGSATLTPHCSRVNCM